MFKRRLLLVDDDNVVVRFLQTILSNEYDVVYYPSAESVLSSAECGSIDVALVDVGLPGMTGLELMGHLRKLNREISIIIVTGTSDLEVAISAIKSGAVDFIVKPFNTKQIHLAVERALEHQRIVREKDNLYIQLMEKNRRLEELNESNQVKSLRIDHDLDMAANLQNCLFPKQIPDTGRVRIRGKYRFVDQISGDFYHIERHSDSVVSVMLADVSGHGIPAALFSAMVKAAITSIDDRDNDPSVIISKVNDFLIKAQIEPSYNYVTILLLRIDYSNNWITYCNAGIPAPLLLKKGGTTDFMRQNSPFVGVFDSAGFIADKILFEPGDRIILFTDGSYEDLDDYNVTVGYKKICAIIEQLAKEDGDILEKLYDRLENSKTKKDDSTYLLVEL